MTSYGSDYTARNQQSGDVVADGGATLLSPFSEGETAIMAGPALLREIQAGVANGDFAVSPVAPTANITDENNLPYWTWTPTTRVTAAIIADNNAGSGNVLQVSTAAGTYSAMEYGTLSRFIAVAASGDRAKTYVPVIRYGASTGSAPDYYAMAQYYKQDQTTTTGTAWEIGMDLQYATIPSDAAYLKITIYVGWDGGTRSAGTQIIQEVRIIQGDSYVYITEETPSSAAAGYIYVTGSPRRFYFSKGIRAKDGDSSFNNIDVIDLSASGNVTVTGYSKLTGSSLSQYDKGGSADTTTITTAGTYYALTNAEVSFSPSFEGQRWLLTFTGYASLNTTVIQYCFVRANVVTTANVNVVDLGFSRADNFGASGRGATVAFTKVYVATAADVTAGTRKFKLYGTTQTTNGLTLSLAYTQMTAYPIG